MDNLLFFKYFVLLYNTFINKEYPNLNGFGR